MQEMISWKTVKPILEELSKELGVTVILEKKLCSLKCH
jgi:hypothetical protein